VIEVSELSKQYGDVTAVDNLTFKAETGQIMGFLGPNGAGKTTTMRILTCYLPPSSGTVTIDGFDIAEASLEVRRRIGYLPELPPLYLDMTVESYLLFVAKIKGVASAQLKSRIDDTMEKTGVAHVARTVIGHLSKGYKQRVGLAQALVHNPSVLILDEPTVGLDPKQIIEIRETIKSLRGEHTIILSTHILPEVAMTCDKVVIISKGRIVGEGSPESLTEQLREGGVLRAQVAGPREAVRRRRAGSWRVSGDHRGWTGCPRSIGQGHRGWRLWFTRTTEYGHVVGGCLPATDERRTSGGLKQCGISSPFMAKSCGLISYPL
jgi:ABC-2 type transport system ATP-binding protein